jgi:hypothetical protein
MSSRSSSRPSSPLGALCAVVLFAGCATSGDAVAPKKQAMTAPVADADDDDAPPPKAPAAPPIAAPAPAAPRASETPRPATGIVAAADPEPSHARSSADPFGDVGFHEVNVKDWLASLRNKLAQQEKVPPSELLMSPGLLRAAYVRSPPVVTPTRPGRRVPPRRHELVVVDNQGRRVASFRAVAARTGDEPPKDLRFLSEDRLVYEVVEPPPEPSPPVVAVPKAKRRPAPRAPKQASKVALPAPPKPATPPPPTRTFVIQPIEPHARPLKCVGVHFTFTREHDHLAFVTGTPEAGFVAVDGGQIYPRRGRTVVASAPAWSKDGHSLAFLESPADRPARLVLVAALDNATGDTTWDLPPTAALDGAAVSWAGAGKLVVSKTPTRPIFSASFTTEAPRRAGAR